MHTLMTTGPNGDNTMKKIILLLAIAAVLAGTSCKKLPRDTYKLTPNGTIVNDTQDSGIDPKIVQGPYRIDSLAAAAGIRDNSNWYYITSNNGVDMQVTGYYLVDCPNCSYTWKGPSVYWVDCCLTGTQLSPRTKPNN